MKRGQVTIFIIVGIIILLIIGFVALNFTVTETEGPERSVLNPYIESCLSGALIDAIESVSLHGGYYNLPEKKLDMYNRFNVPYYLYEDIKAVPTKSQIEGEIGDLTSTLVSLCNLEYFEERGYEVTTGEIHTNVEIIKNGVIAELNYPITLERDGISMHNERFSVEVESILNTYYENAVEFADKIEDRQDIPLSDVMFAGIEDEFYTYFIHENQDVLFSFYDNKSIPEKFNFAVRFSPVSPDEALFIQEIPPQIAYVGYEFFYEFDLDVTAETDMFEIEDKKINFTPKIQDVGNHMIVISNDYGWTYMVLTITSDTEPPHIEPITDKTLDVGEEFNYIVRMATESDVTFIAETDLEDFNINPSTGEVNFIPTAEQTGDHTVKIIAVDNYGEKDEKEFQIGIND